MICISNMRLGSLFLILLFNINVWLRGDLIILKDGQIINGIILQQDSSGVLLKFDYGTFTFSNERIKEIKKEFPTNVETPESNQRIPCWSQIISILSKQQWVRDMRQIPATVINVGVLKNVPYLSFAVNNGLYEANIYGDMDHPAGFEIGAKSYLINNETAKSNCLEFVCLVLTQAEDKDMIHRLNRSKDNVIREGLTLEITPSTDFDSYGSWWISVYNKEELDKSRASDKELLVITESITNIASPVARSQVVTSASSTANRTVLSPWTQDDLGYARPYRIGTGSTRGGSVYVRSYYRNNGTYVHAYTRRASGR